MPEDEYVVKANRDTQPEEVPFLVPDEEPEEEPERIPVSSSG